MDAIIRQQVVERDGAACVDCGRAADQIHHVIPKSAFGKNTKHRCECVENMVCICWVCHGQDAGRKREHLELLRERHGYEYGALGQPWIGVLGEAVTED